MGRHINSILDSILNRHPRNVSAPTGSGEERGTEPMAGLEPAGVHPRPRVPPPSRPPAAETRLSGTLPARQSSHAADDLNVDPLPSRSDSMAPGLRLTIRPQIEESTFQPGQNASQDSTTAQRSITDLYNVEHLRTPNEQQIQAMNEFLAWYEEHRHERSKYQVGEIQIPEDADIITVLRDNTGQCRGGFTPNRNISRDDIEALAHKTIQEMLKTTFRSPVATAISTSLTGTELNADADTRLISGAGSGATAYLAVSAADVIDSANQKTGRPRLHRTSVETIMPFCSAWRQQWSLHNHQPKVFFGLDPNYDDTKAIIDFERKNLEACLKNLNGKQLGALWHPAVTGGTGTVRRKFANEQLRNPLTAWGIGSVTSASTKLFTAATTHAVLLSMNYKVPHLALTGSNVSTAKRVDIRLYRSERPEPQRTDANWASVALHEFYDRIATGAQTPKDALTRFLGIVFAEVLAETSGAGAARVGDILYRKLTMRTPLSRQSEMPNSKAKLAAQFAKSFMGDIIWSSMQGGTSGGVFPRAPRLTAAEAGKLSQRERKLKSLQRLNNQLHTDVEALVECRQQQEFFETKENLTENEAKDMQALNTSIPLLSRDLQEATDAQAEQAGALAMPEFDLAKAVNDVRDKVLDRLSGEDRFPGATIGTKTMDGIEYRGIFVELDQHNPFIPLGSRKDITQHNIRVGSEALTSRLGPQVNIRPLPGQAEMVVELDAWLDAHYIEPAKAFFGPDVDPMASLELPTHLSPAEFNAQLRAAETRLTVKHRWSEITMGDLARGLKVSLANIGNLSLTHVLPATLITVFANALLGENAENQGRNTTDPRVMALSMACSGIISFVVRDLLVPAIRSDYNGQASDRTAVKPDDLVIPSASPLALVKYSADDYILERRDPVQVALMEVQIERKRKSLPAQAQYDRPSINTLVAQALLMGLGDAAAWWLLGNKLHNPGWVLMLGMVAATISGGLTGLLGQLHASTRGNRVTGPLLGGSINNKLVHTMETERSANTSLREKGGRVLDLAAAAASMPVTTFLSVGGKFLSRMIPQLHARGYADAFGNIWRRDSQKEQKPEQEEEGVIGKSRLPVDHPANIAQAGMMSVHYAFSGAVENTLVPRFPTPAEKLAYNRRRATAAGAPDHPGEQFV